jgi:hypothetical protein
MKNSILLIIILFIVFGYNCCRKEYKIDEKHYIKEKNISSYNIFYQFFLEDGNVYRNKLLKNMESDSNEPYSRYPDNYPYWSYTKSPNELLKKVLIVDLDSRKILKCIEGNDIENLYKLYAFDSVYGEKIKYYILEITDEWLKNIENDN